MRPTRRVIALAGLVSLASALAIARDASAQTAAPPAQQLSNPAALPARGANFSWDNDLLRASFSFRDMATAAVKNKLGSGLPNTIVMRAYVFEDGSTDPVALAARTCTVVYDLWDEVYRVKIVDPSGERETAAINVDGVVRRCMDAQDFPIVVRALLKKGKPHFLGVIAEVNPISPQMLQQIRQWVSRPTGATALTAGDALFSSFVSLFVQQIGNADGTKVFRSQTFAP